MFSWPKMALTKLETEGRPVSTVWWAVSRYSGSRCANNSRKRAMGSATCSSGRLWSWRKRRIRSSGWDCKYTTVPAARKASRLAGRNTAPPPVASTPGAWAQSWAITSCSISRKRASPSRSKNSRMEQPSRNSMAWSESKKGCCKRRARCLPTVDLPEPGRPMRMIK